MARGWCQWGRTIAKLDFTHFRRHERGNLRVDDTERPGVPEHQYRLRTVKNLPRPATGGAAPERGRPSLFLNFAEVQQSCSIGAVVLRDSRTPRLELWIPAFAGKTGWGRFHWVEGLCNRPGQWGRTIAKLFDSRRPAWRQRDSRVGTVEPRSRLRAGDVLSRE